LKEYLACIIYLPVDSFQVTLFHFEDEPRSGVCEVIYTLREKAKLRIMMLTGDHKSSAMRVAKAVCIDEVHFSLKPEDKLNKVKAVSREGGSPLSCNCQISFYDYYDSSSIFICYSTIDISSLVTHYLITMVWFLLNFTSFHTTFLI
jgi:magnesium-transporting ATPase (P-type)